MQRLRWNRLVPQRDNFFAVYIILWFPKNFKRILVYKYDLYTFFSCFYDNFYKSPSFSSKVPVNPVFCDSFVEPHAYLSIKLSFSNNTAPGRREKQFFCRRSFCWNFGQKHKKTVCPVSAKTHTAADLFCSVDQIFIHYSRICARYRHGLSRSSPA